VADAVLQTLRMGWGVSSNPHAVSSIVLCAARNARRPPRLGLRCASGHEYEGVRKQHAAASMLVTRSNPVPGHRRSVPCRSRGGQRCDPPARPRANRLGQTCSWPGQTARRWPASSFRRHAPPRPAHGRPPASWPCGAARLALMAGAATRSPWERRGGLFPAKLNVRATPRVVPASHRTSMRPFLPWRFGPLRRATAPPASSDHPGER
jgi:hypothetical protein